jgi:hypothetical protein
MGTASQKGLALVGARAARIFENEKLQNLV